jgi:ketosteroid isomerase-like protein
MLHRAVFPLVVVSSLLAPQPPSAPSDVEKELRQRTQELLDAVAPGRVDVWRRLLHEQMIHVDENGIVRTKSEFLAQLQPLPAGLEGTLQIASFQVQVHGDVAVATHEERETLIYFGQKLDSRFRTTDTWLRTSEGWRLIAAQVLAVPADPPAITLDAKQLCAYAGVFSLTADISATVNCRNGELVAERTGRPAVSYHPETVDVFFSPGQPRTRRIFQRDSSGTITGFVDRREGHDIVWRKIR